MGFVVRDYFVYLIPEFAVVLLKLEMNQLMNDNVIEHA
jgi:hypothetical protein